MDLFNKKKVENLERELRIVREEFERNKGKLLALEEFNYNEKTNQKLIEENQKLIQWIENILKEFGTFEAREQHVSIPIFKRAFDPIFYKENDYTSIVREEEHIEIPAITIIKMH